VLAFRDSDGVVEIIDGFRRRRVAAMQGFPARLCVRVIEVDEPSALAAMFSLRRPSMGLSELEESWVVRALVRQHGLAQVEVAQLLRRHQSWVSRRLMLVEALAEQVQMDVRLGLVSPTAAREVARLPRGIQQTVARIIARQGMSTRAAAKLVAATEQMKPTTAEAFERLCQEQAAAQAAAQAQAAAPACPGPRSDMAAYTSDIGQVERGASGLLKRLRVRPPSKIGPPYDRQIHDQLRATSYILRTLLDTVIKILEES
jgi:ParB-like chromosome segregation protein Spo0J